MVREHVLKGKDPNQILEEIEKLDEMGMVHLMVHLFLELIMLLNQILLLFLSNYI